MIRELISIVALALFVAAVILIAVGVSTPAAAQVPTNSPEDQIGLQNAAQARGCAKYQAGRVAPASLKGDERIGAVICQRNQVGRLMRDLPSRPNGVVIYERTRRVHCSRTGKTTTCLSW